MKVAAILAVAGAIVGEFLGSDRGLGYLMLQVQVTLDTAAMFMAVIPITLIGVGLYALGVPLEGPLVARDPPPAGRLIGEPVIPLPGVEKTYRPPGAALPALSPATLAL